MLFYILYLWHTSFRKLKYILQKIYNLCINLLIDIARNFVFYYRYIARELQLKNIETQNFSSQPLTRRHSAPHRAENMTVWLSYLQGGATLRGGYCHFNGTQFCFSACIPLLISVLSIYVSCWIHCAIRYAIVWVFFQQKSVLRKRWQARKSPMKIRL